MDLVLRASEPRGVPVLSLEGEVDLGSLPKLRDRFVRLAAEHPGQIVVVDLDGVGVLDDAGLGALVGGLGRLRATGGDVCLVCTVPRLLELLALTRLDRVFSVHPSVAAAVGAARA
jgi:anti-sigma B factor antagonist